MLSALLFHSALAVSVPSLGALPVLSAKQIQTIPVPVPAAEFTCASYVCNF